MSKQDWIWVAIRIFGIYLLVLAVIALPKFLGAAILLWTSLRGYDFFEIEAMNDAQRLFIDNALRGAFVSLFTIVINTAIGIYMIRGGGWLFRLICPPDPEQSLTSKKSIDLSGPKQTAA